MVRTAKLIVFLGLTMALSHTWAKESVKEPATGVAFVQTLDGLELMGVGVRKMLVVNVYAAALYVDPAGFKEAVGAKGAKGANRALHRGHFNRRMLLHFVRKVPAKKIREAFRDSLIHNMSEEDYAAEKANIDTFLAACGDVGKGEVFEFETRGNRVTVTLRGKTIFKSKSRRLVKGMWGSYFGKRPINEKLRKSLLKGAGALLGAE